MYMTVLVFIMEDQLYVFMIIPSNLNLDVQILEFESEDDFLEGRIKEATHTHYSLGIRQYIPKRAGMHIKQVHNTSILNLN